MCRLGQDGQHRPLEGQHCIAWAHSPAGHKNAASSPPLLPAVLSVDVLDIAGTAENDASFAKGMNLHKVRLDAQGRQIGKKEYYTPQSQQIVDDGQGGAMMNVNVPLALKVSGRPAARQLFYCR